jgi:NAD(P)-dependent dehydrogenase (short-subunit alcohol dehydrogenase family)
MFHDKHCVITGAASGIGAAISKRLNESGAKVSLLDRDVSGLQHLAGSLAAGNLDVFHTPCDVTDDESCRDAIERSIAQNGPIDVLVCNAGIGQRGPATQLRAEVVKRVVEVNFLGAVQCTLHALPSLIERRGRIAVVSSVAGYSPLLGRAAYCASKHALHGFFDTLRAELRPTGVTVTIVCPSFTASNFEANSLAGDGAPVRRPRSKIGKLATPEDVAAAVCDATAARKRLVILAAQGKAAYWLSRIAPGVYERMMARTFRSEIAGEG